MTDNNSFGGGENPWDNDPSKQQPEEPAQAQQPQDPFGAPFGNTSPSIPMPPPPPVQAPQMGTYYGNAQGYSVSGPKTDSFSVTGMVLGIIGLLATCCWPLAAVLDVMAVIFSALAMNRIKKSDGNLSGRGMAIAGLVLGIIGILAIAGLLLLALLGDGSSSFRIN